MNGLVQKVVPNFIRRSYAIKFTIALLILGLSVGSIGLVGTAQLQDGIQSNVFNDHESVALQESNSVARFHEENIQTASSVADTGQLNGAVGDVEDYLEAEIEALDGGGEGEPHLHLLSSDTGDVVASTMVDSESDVELGGEWVNNLEEDTYVTDVYESDEYDGNTERVAYVTDRSGVPSGQVLVYTVPLEEYNINTADGTYAMVLDSSGGENGYDMVAFGESGNERHAASTSPVMKEYTEDQDPIEAARNPNTPEADAMEAGPAYDFLEEDFFGAQEYVVGYATVEGTDWVVLVHTSAEQAYGFVNDVQFYGLIATGGAVLLIGLVGAVIGWNTSRSIDQLTQKASRMEAGDLDVELESSRIDSIGRLYDGFDNMRDSLKTQMKETNQAREEAEEARAEAERLNDHLESKADDYSEVMQSAGDGDLTARMDPEGENEAMSEIATEFNEMIAELEQTTATVKSFATEVATASEEVTASSEEVRSASEQVAESVQEISEGADKQNDSLQSINQEMNGLSTTIEEIAASSNQVAELAERTAQTGERGREAAQEAIEGMQELETESESAVEEIERLEEEMEQIDELLDFITEVAEQTNMLALNANIEASRSSNSSEGFSAVAGEVKDLAEETRDAAADIEDRLERIKEQTDRTADEVQRTSERVSEHTDSVEQAADALDEIADYAVETNTGVQEIANASDEQAASTQEVVAMVDEVAVIAEQTNTESETVAAAAEEQTTALTEVSRSAGNLANRAVQLSETIDHFDTDSDADTETESIDETFETDVSFDETDGIDSLEEAFDGSLGDDGDDTATTEGTEPDGATGVTDASESDGTGSPGTADGRTDDTDVIAFDEEEQGGNDTAGLNGAGSDAESDDPLTVVDDDETAAADDSDDETMAADDSDDETMAADDSDDETTAADDSDEESDDDATADGADAFQFEQPSDER